MVQIAIDGPAGSGKSSTAKVIAERFGLTYIDTGAMYRAVALACVRRGVDVEDPQKVLDVAKQSMVSFQRKSDGLHTLLDNDDVTDEIRTVEINKKVSPVAANAQVREVLVERQRELGRTDPNGVVMDGRDIGTVVFPDADLKIYMVASSRQRAERRLEEMRSKGNKTISLEEVEEDLLRRDKVDSEREASPLRPAEDAIHIDTTSIDFNKQVDEVCKLVAPLVS